MFFHFYIIFFLILLIENAMCIDNNLFYEGAEKGINSRLKIALLVPVTSKSLPINTPIQDTYLFSNLLKSITNTLSKSELEKYSISMYLGFDANDKLYDAVGSSKQIKKYVELLCPFIQLKLIRMTGSIHRIGYIWNYLTMRAYKNRNDYYIILSDDAILKSNDWISEIVLALQFNSNIGVVSFFEQHKYTTHGTWPTFPCFSNVHIEIFTDVDDSSHKNQIVAFDPVFTNSFVDIWLSDVYIIFNCSMIVKTAIIDNAIGGEDVPRYNPIFPGWDVYVSAVERGRERVVKYFNKWSQNASTEEISQLPSVLSKFIDFPDHSPLAVCTEESEGLVEVNTETSLESIDHSKFIKNEEKPSLAYGTEGYHFKDICRVRQTCIN